MKVGWLLAAMVVTAADSSHAEDAAVLCRGDARVCATLVAAERDLTGMLVTGEVAAIRRHFADDAIWSLGSGRRWTKAQALVAVAKAPRLANSRLVQAEVRRFDRTAIVVWTEAWREVADGPEQRSVGTDTWLLRNGRWQIIASQEARVPTAG